jgi:2EXR family
MPCHFPTPRLPSPVLHVSQEAREVTLRHYKLLYRLSSPLPLIYIDPKVDVLFVNEHIQRLDEVLSELDPDVLHSLGHIALESMMMFVFSNIVGRFFPCLLRLSNLEKITVTLPPTEPEQEGGYALLFELLRIPMAEWPDTVQRRDEHLFTQRALEHCRDKGHLDDPRWLRTGFNKITQAIEERFRANPGRALPLVDLKGVRRI